MLAMLEGAERSDRLLTHVAAPATNSDSGTVRLHTKLADVVQLKAKTDELGTLQCHFDQLKEDFLHNEGVLLERDDELAACEATLQDISDRLARSQAAEQSAASCAAALRTELGTQEQRHARLLIRLAMQPARMPKLP
jgi:chromosome segregation ATPase